MRHEADETIQVVHPADDPSQDPPYGLYRLNLPKFVNAFDVRSHFYLNGLDLLAEVAWKIQTRRSTTTTPIPPDRP